MRKLFYLGFCLALATGVGCVISDYPIITDTDQVANGPGFYTVNTNGKAHLVEHNSYALIVGSDVFESLWFADQKANGDQTLYTYMNSTPYGAGNYFHGDLYCNPDWQGCAVATADNPVVGDASIFDYNANFSCKGSAAISLIISMSSRYGECGRAISKADQVALINMARVTSQNGKDGLLWSFSPSNTTILVDNNAGVVESLRLNGDASLFQSGNTNVKQSWTDLRNPLNASNMREMARFGSQFGTNHTTLTLVYNGIQMQWNVGGFHNAISSPAHLTQIANTLW